MIHLLYAVALLCGMDATLAGTMQLRAIVRAVALDMELMDDRETRYVLARNDDFAADVRILQRRYHELADAPLACDAYRFPDRSDVGDVLVFNRACRDFAENRLSLYRGPHVQLQEYDRLYQIYDLVRDARCDYYYVPVRRDALKKLRELIGEEAYYLGKLPPVVPTWRFTVRD